MHEGMLLRNKSQSVIRHLNQKVRSLSFEFSICNGAGKHKQDFKISLFRK